MSRLCLKNPLGGPCPPNGYLWKCPEDGWESHAWDYRTWVAQARRHYTINGLPVPDNLEADMQEQLCLKLEPGWCDYDDPNRLRVSVDMNWGDMVRGLQTMKDWLLSGCKVVAQTESDRRASVCARCYYNMHIEGCSQCQKMVAEVVGQHKTQYDNRLRGCGVCKCVLSAKVHFPLKLLLDNEDEKLQSLYPEHCWLKKEGQNFNGDSCGS